MKNTLSVKSEVFAEISKGIEAARVVAEREGVIDLGLEVGVPAPKLTKAQKELLAIEEKMALELAENVLPMLRSIRLLSISLGTT